ncbi:hypothetical protein ABGB19_23450 [Mycobacterium sp. B14F4]|uniref:hypothetical protein n=1 Tax=Mycobacterium sp. B14F4 TaxID=3153565 RepID=UPI00325CCF77
MAKNGYQTLGDVVKKTADGINYSVVWEELNEIRSLWNEERNKIAALLSYPTTSAADAVPQTLSDDSFTVASEYGVPPAVSPASAVLCGYSFQDYNLATRFTWKFLREATFDQVREAWASVLAADSKLTAGKVLQRIFTPTQGLSPEGNPVRGLWNGSDGLAPLPHMGMTFPSSTSHYVATENATLDSLDVEDAMNMITQKGYGTNPGSQIIILANPVQSEQIQSWRAGVESRTSGPVAKFDFIPSASAPAYLTDKRIVGSTAPTDYSGLPVKGSYGRGWLIESNYVPLNYVLVAATNGPNNPGNVCAFREHVSNAWRGLLLIPGNQQRFPLQESFGHRAFGTGVRHRGAAIALHVTASSTYTPPTIIANQ